MKESLASRALYAEIKYYHDFSDNLVHASANIGVTNITWAI